jgi:hypothetical protein
MPKFIRLTAIAGRNHRDMHVNIDAIRTVHETVVRNPDGPNTVVTVVTLPESELHVIETPGQVLDLIARAI